MVNSEEQKNSCRVSACPKKNGVAVQFPQVEWN